MSPILTATASATRCGLLPVFKSGLGAGKPALAIHPIMGTLGGAGGTGGRGKLPGKTGAGRGLMESQEEPGPALSFASSGTSFCLLCLRLLCLCLLCLICLLCLPCLTLQLLKLCEQSRIVNQLVAHENIASPPSQHRRCCFSIPWTPEALQVRATPGTHLCRVTPASHHLKGLVTPQPCQEPMCHSQ